MFNSYQTSDDKKVKIMEGGGVNPATDFQIKAHPPFYLKSHLLSSISQVVLKYKSFLKIHLMKNISLLF